MSNRGLPRQRAARSVNSRLCPISDFSLALATANGIYEDTAKQRACFHGLGKMGKIQIISGDLRGRGIQTPGEETTRPLLSRLRKTLADILRPRLPGAAVLDLFGGSGAIAFELLSNGAKHADIVELDPAAAALVRGNAERLVLQERVQVHCGDALRMIERLKERGASFDIIVVAPPYGEGLQQQAVNALAPAGLINASGIIIVQRDKREPSTQPVPPLCRVRTRSYGRTVFEFFDSGQNTVPALHS